MIANLYILRVRQESHLVGKRFGELSLRVAGSNLLAVERQFPARSRDHPSHGANSTARQRHTFG